MKIALIILSVLVTLLYLKWIVILLLFPFQVLNARPLKRWGKGKQVPWLYRALLFPYKQWEKIMHNGWQRYMLFQISMIPSHHLRRFVYKCLGAEIGKNVVFHFRVSLLSNLSGFCSGNYFILMPLRRSVSSSSRT